MSVTYSGFRAIDEVIKLKPLIESFVSESRFNEFYLEHQPYYNSLHEEFLEAVPTQSIRDWLGSQFPSKVDSQVIFFSPLGRGSNSSRGFSEGDFSEAILFVNSPSSYNSETLSKDYISAIITRGYFTELDHPYVNPVSDNFIPEIELSLSDIGPWYRGGSYNAPYATFNEYMTWSVFCIYAKEHFQEEKYEFILEYVENIMVNNRGFFKFSEFNRELTQLFEDKESGETVVDLYPQILSWIRNNN